LNINKIYELPWGSGALEPRRYPWRSSSILWGETRQPTCWPDKWGTESSCGHRSSPL